MARFNQSTATLSLLLITLVTLGVLSAAPAPAKPTCDNPDASFNLIVSDAAIIDGTDGPDLICAGPGNNLINGLGGNDLIFGSEGSDTISGGGGADRIRGGAGDDVITGGPGDDKIAGGPGDDKIRSGRGHDIVNGGVGADFIQGGPGDDKLRGGARSDRIIGGPGNDRIAGGNGNDRLIGQDGDDVLFGGVGDDTITGGAGDDQLRGGGGDDNLDGNDGNDRSDGRGGSDTCTAEETVNCEPNTNPPPSGIIFETDFSADTGYSVTRLGLWNGGSNNPTAPPTGWDGVIATGDSVVSVQTGEGLDGGNALKLEWDPNLSQPTLSLAKHLTGDPATGFDELFIRYRVRFPNDFAVGRDGDRLFYWKWGRLWQNTGVEAHSNWTENRPDSHYVVWNWGGNVPYTDTNVVWGENFGENLQMGSAGGERTGIDYFISGSDQHDSPGYFESLWDINTTDRPGGLENNQNQTWHTIEYRFKLATSPTSRDGEFEMWWDGENQGPYARSSAEGIPTARMGSGFNLFVFFDNLAGWNDDWSQPDVDGFIFVNDVVVSTERIGDSYAAG